MPFTLFIVFFPPSVDGGIHLRSLVTELNQYGRLCVDDMCTDQFGGNSGAGAAGGAGTDADADGGAGTDADDDDTGGIFTPTVGSVQLVSPVMLFLQ